MTFTITTAVREQRPALIGLWGISGSGKTYSALKLARGLVGTEGAVCLIDTENKRSTMYSGLIDQWTHLDFQPPFSPKRYIEAAEAAIASGAQVIIFDSFSHVWEGESGVLEMADAEERNGKRDLRKWAGPKAAFKSMQQSLLRLPVHVIFCLRAKDKMVMVPNPKSNRQGAQVPISGGLVPIPDKHFIYELDVSMRLDAGSHAISVQEDRPSDLVTSLKVPEPMASMIKRGQMVDEEMGRQIAEFFASGPARNNDAQDVQAEARRIATTKGVEGFRAWYGKLDRAKRPALQQILQELQSSAEQCDADRQSQGSFDAQNDDPFGLTQGDA